MKLFIAFCIAVLALGCSKTEKPSTTRLDSVNAPATLAHAMPEKAPDPVPLPQDTTTSTASAPVTIQPGSGKRKQFAPYLKTEQKFLSGESVSSRSTEELLSSRKFNSIAIEFERESASSPDAQALTDLYRQEIQRQLGDSARLTTLSCGNSLCLGSILTHSENTAYEKWSKVFFESPRTPNYVFSETTLKRGLNFENRFIFSTDPAINSVIGPPQRR